jgi:NAD(P)-dependent dehydrogenase (short-subunit alcohol dehydrogenase family)
MKGLREALEDNFQAPDPSPRLALADRLILPGIWRFTRLGYSISKSRFTGINADLSDQTIVITGATSGIGAAAARSLAQLGAKLIIVARNAKKAQAFVDRLEQEGLPRPRIELADLSLMADVSALATRLLDRGEAIDVLINNAGALFNQRVVTAEGVEQSFATLLLSPYILTEMLYPLLRKAGSARVINVSSGGMYTQALQIDDLEFEQDDYNGSRAYARAKRGLVDLTEVWAKAWQKDGITVHAMHPGWADTPAVLDSLPKFYELTKPWLRTPEQGADTVVWLAAAAEAEASTGLFWLDRTPHSTAIFPGTKSSPDTQASLRIKLDSYRQRLSQQESKNKL